MVIDGGLTWVAVTCNGIVWTWAGLSLDVVKIACDQGAACNGKVSAKVMTPASAMTIVREMRERRLVHLSELTCKK